MNTKKLLSAALVAAVLTGIYFPTEKTLAQYPNIPTQGEFGNRFRAPIDMVVSGDTTGERQRTSHFGVMDPIGLRPNEQLGITLIVPSNRINYPVGIAPLDGGEIFASPNLSVTGNATVSFTFQAGHTPGLYRVLVTIASEPYELQLYVARPHDIAPDCVNP